MAPKQAATVKKRDMTLGERIGKFMRANEKVLWVVLLVLISFSFAFTGAMSSFFSAASRDTLRFTYFGEEVSQFDFEETVNGLRKVRSLREGALGLYQMAGLISEPDVRERFATWKFFGGRAEGTGYDIIDFYVFQEEADRLGIYVSDAELGKAVRFLYWPWKAREAAAETPLAEETGQLDTAELKSRLAQLRRSRAFDFPSWAEMLRSTRTGKRMTPRAFEAFLRKQLRAEKLLAYIENSVQVTMDEVRERFLEEEQLRKVSFFTYEPDEAERERIAASVTEEELREYYDENEQQFVVRMPQLRYEYVLIPFDHFEAEIEPTEEQIVAHYEKVRDEKYRRSLEVDLSSFDLLDEEEAREREEKLYVPLEEVREEVVESLVDELARKGAEDFALQLKPRLFPSGTDAEARDVDVEAVAAEHEFVTYGQTPFHASYQSQDEAGSALSSRVDTWFTTMSSNQRATDESKRRPIETSSVHYTNRDQDALVFYPSVEVLQPGEESFELLRDTVQEQYVTKKLLDAHEEKAEAIVAQIRDGEGSFEEVAESLGQPVHTSGFVEQYGQIYITPEKEDGEKAKAEEGEATGEGESTEDDEDEPAREYFRGSRWVLQEAFSIQEDGSVGEPVRDENEGVFYIVRLEDHLEPAPEDFDDAMRERYRRQLLQDRRSFHVNQWRSELIQRAEVKINPNWRA